MDLKARLTLVFTEGEQSIETTYVIPVGQLWGDAPTIEFQVPNLATVREAFASKDISRLFVTGGQSK